MFITPTKRWASSSSRIQFPAPNSRAWPLFSEPEKDEPQDETVEQWLQSHGLGSNDVQGMTGRTGNHWIRGLMRYRISEPEEKSTGKETRVRRREERAGGYPFLQRKTFPFFLMTRIRHPITCARPADQRRSINCSLAEDEAGGLGRERQRISPSVFRNITCMQIEDKLMLFPVFSLSPRLVPMFHNVSPIVVSIVGPKKRLMRLEDGKFI